MVIGSDIDIDPDIEDQMFVPNYLLYWIQNIQILEHPLGTHNLQHKISDLWWVQLV